MALATQNANLVRQKAYTAVYSALKVGTTTAQSPYHFYAIKALFLHLAANKGNPDLQFIPYAAEDIATGTTGYNPDVDACKVYAFYIAGRRASATTVAFISLHDATTNGATTTTIATQRLNLTGQQALFVWPDGFPIATDITIASADAVGGSTETTAALAADGFVIIGAA